MLEMNNYTDNLLIYSILIIILHILISILI